MKRRCLILILPLVFVCSCAAPWKKVMFIPDPLQNTQEQTGMTGEIIESQNGSGETGIPVWVNLHLKKKSGEIEDMAEYSGKYIFVGENRGDTIGVLRQWVDNFSAVRDLPRLIAHRTEQRLIAGASLYPDDEYGEYFERLIRKVSDEEYAGAAIEQTFWLKQKVKVVNEENDPDDPPQGDVFYEYYEFLILISIDKEILQKQIGEIMTNITTKTNPTREQTSAINRIKRTFFEGF